MAKGDDIEERLVRFGVKIIELCSEFPKTDIGRHVSGQLLRCGTSPASNYSEARGAESSRDFIHKLGIVLKELNESSIWLRMTDETQLVTDQQVGQLRAECTELSKIIAVSIRTALARHKK